MAPTNLNLTAMSSGDMDSSRRKIPRELKIEQPQSKFV
jgi:hypothetical protein